MWLLLYLLHIAYLSIVKFDYGYNMAACVVAGLLWLYIVCVCVCGGGGDVVSALSSARYTVYSCVDGVEYQGRYDPVYCQM